MSCSYFVYYKGIPDDPESFLDHYRKKHGPILKKYPKIRSCLLHRPVAWTDPATVNPPDGMYLLAELKFDSVEDLNEALASDARQESRKDFVNFPHFNGEVRHQAVVTEVQF